MSASEIDESHAQFRGAWRLFALGSPQGEVVERREVFIAAGHVTWPLMNAAFLNAPVEREQDLARSIESAARYFAQGRHGWSFAYSEDWLSPALRPRAASLLQAHGLSPGMSIMGMAAERLQTPVRPPPPLDLLRVKDTWGYNAVADINATCYDVPREVGREALASPDIYGPACRAFVGCLEDKPVTTTSVLKVDDIAYVALVATLPEHRRTGAAESVMRQALMAAKQDWGLERAVLHATAAGRPVYQRMGFHDVTPFQLFFSPPPGG
ncbi:GNAT family N-acetyltransferase [Corallococcus sp. H22C18031201]|nr:GNAT family N-acetyltransferase [Corallococcus sp. H22C18031201]